MSDDLISRQTAIEFIKEHSYLVRYDGNSIEQGMTITGIEQALNEVPSVQPEQKTATFYIDSEGYERCSECNEHESGMMYFNFCPNCGAKMGNRQ